MTSINDVPYDDIEKFLIINDVELISKDQDYNKAFKMISNDKNYIYPDIIVDWIAAYNLNGKRFRNYSRGEIDLLSKNELTRLAKNLGVGDSNNHKQSVINVLKFLKKLDSKLIMKDIDEQIFQTLDEQRILTTNLVDIIEIFRKNKTLRKFIYDNMRTILFLKKPLKKGELFAWQAVETMSKFVVELVKMNEMVLAKEALRLLNELITHEDNRVNLNSYLNHKLTKDNNVKLMEAYFKLLPYLEELFPNESFEDDTILELFEVDSRYETTKEYRDHIIPFFTAAINAKRQGLIDYVVNIWNNEKRYYTEEEDQSFVNEMNALMERI